MWNFIDRLKGRRRRGFIFLWLLACLGLGAAFFAFSGTGLQGSFNRGFSNYYRDATERLVPVAKNISLFSYNRILGEHFSPNLEFDESSVWLYILSKSKSPDGENVKYKNMRKLFRDVFKSKQLRVYEIPFPGNIRGTHKCIMSPLVPAAIFYPFIENLSMNHLVESETPWFWRRYLRSFASPLDSPLSMKSVEQVWNLFRKSH